MADPGWGSFLWNEIGKYIAPGAPFLAAIAWIAKRYINAKDAEISALKTQISSITSNHTDQIKAKEAHIAAIEGRVTSLQELNPMKIKEYFLTTKEMMEQYNNDLQERLNGALGQLQEKDAEIVGLKIGKSVDQGLLEQRDREKAELERTVSLLKAQLNAPREKITIEFPKFTTRPSLYGMPTLANFNIFEPIANIDTRIGVLADLTKGLEKRQESGEFEVTFVPQKLPPPPTIDK